MRTKVLNHFHTFHPDAQAEFDRLKVEEAHLTRAIARRGQVDTDAKPRRASEPPVDLEADLAKVQARMDEQRAIIASGVVRVVLKGLTRGEFRRLILKHPAREDNPLDQQVGYNTDTFGDALIQASIVTTQDLDGEPVPNEWDTWADEMTNGQWEEFFQTARSLSTEGQPRFPR